MYTYKTIIFDLDGTLFKGNEATFDAVKFRGGIENVLDRLKNQGYTLGLCSNGSREVVNQALEHYGINEYFEIIKAGNVGLKKFQLIKQILEESASCSAILVGDTTADIAAAEDTKCISIAISNGGGERFCKSADFIADNTEDICEIIRKINGADKSIIGQVLRRKPGSDIEDKIQLIDIEEKQVEEIIKMLQDEEAREMLGVTTLPELEDYKGKNIAAKAIVTEDKEFVGTVELFDISWKNRRGELSIEIKPEMRGKGYGYAALNKMLEIAFLEFGMNRVWLRVIETNTKAIRLYKKAGFIQEGICRGESLRKGRFVNQIQMSILAEEWNRY